MDNLEHRFVLASVAVVCRHWPRVEALPHAVLLIQEFTENISPDALTNVLERGETQLFRRVLHAVDESLNMVFHEKLRQYRCAMELVIRHMPLEEGKLKAVKELYQRYPGAATDSTIRLVAHMSELPMLRWLQSIRSLSTKKFSWSIDTIFMFASIQGRMEVVRWLERLFPKGLRSLEYAAGGGHLDLIKWLMKHTNWDQNSLKPAFYESVKAGHLATAKFLYEHKPPTECLVTVESFEMMKWLDEVKVFKLSRCTLDHAVQEGDLDKVQWLYANDPALFTSWEVETAVKRGHLEIIKFLSANRGRFTTDVMNCAAKNGYLEIVQWLHENRQEGCTTKAMDDAAQCGHLEVVQWLHENRAEGCTVDAMDSAAQNGHLDVLNWLDANRNEGCTLKAMSMAAHNHRWEAVQWLHEQRGLKLPEDVVHKSSWTGSLQMIKWLHSSDEGNWSKDTMDMAAKYGHLDIVKFLHGHRREGCTVKAMDGAAENKHWEVFKWLHANKRQKYTKKAMNSAAKQGNLEIVKWIHAQRKVGCTAAAMSAAAIGGHLKVMKFLAANFTITWSEAAIRNAVTYGHAEAVKWLHFHLRQSLSANDAIRAARYGHIGVLDVMNNATDFCSNSSVFFVGCGNHHPEVAEWYKDHYGNPRKRKY